MVEPPPELGNAKEEQVERCEENEVLGLLYKCEHLQVCLFQEALRLS